MRQQPDYYASNGLSPIEAMKQGLISQEQYSGFLIGNIIKYVVRAGKKDNAIEDLRKAKDYINFYMDIFCMTPEEQAELDKEFLRMPDEISAVDIPITLNVDNDLDMEEFEEKLEKLIEEVKNEPVTMVPTNDPNIVKLKLSEVMYDENGDLVPEARESIREYLLKNREANKID